MDRAHGTPRYTTGCSLPPSDMRLELSTFMARHVLNHRCLWDPHSPDLVCCHVQHLRGWAGLEETMAEGLHMPSGEPL